MVGLGGGAGAECVPPALLMVDSCKCLPCCPAFPLLLQ